MIDGAESAETARSLALLEASGYRTRLAAALREAVLSAEVEPEGGPTLATRLTTWARRLYERIVGIIWFQRAIVLAFAANAAGTIFAAAGSAASVPMGLMMRADQSFVALSQVVGSGAASLMTVVGVALLARSRLHAYRWFKRSVLVPREPGAIATGEGAVD